MKHIRLFEENNNTIYEVEDYILFKDEYIKFWKKNKSGISNNVFKFAKITGLNIKNDDRYILEVIEDNEIEKYYLEEKYFERKLTEEEILEYEIKKESLKFNI